MSASLVCRVQKAGADGNRTHQTSHNDVPPVLKTGAVTRAAFTPEGILRQSVDSVDNRASSAISSAGNTVRKSIRTLLSCTRAKTAG